MSRTPRDVPAETHRLFPLLLARQTAKGVRKYGRPLQTWNKRDAGNDALEELIDALQYVVQLRLERDDLLAENARLTYLLHTSGITVEPTNGN